MEKILVYAPGREFIMPYMRRSLAPLTVVGIDDAEGADMALMVSSCDVYGKGELVGLAEDEPVDRSSGWWAQEELFRQTCGSVPAYILRCSNVVGTRMTGFPAELAASIWRGLFFHFPDNDARISTVHASDVAALASLLARGEGRQECRIYNVTDGIDPSLHDFVEALAFRMKNKRVSTLSTKPQQWIGRMLYGSKRYGEYTTTRTFSSARLAADFPEFHPAAVTEYLRTHVYDETSL